MLILCQLAQPTQARRQPQFSLPLLGKATRIGWAHRSKDTSLEGEGKFWWKMQSICITDLRCGAGYSFLIPVNGISPQQLLGLHRVFQWNWGFICLWREALVHLKLVMTLPLEGILPAPPPCPTSPESTCSSG